MKGLAIPGLESECRGGKEETTMKLVKYATLVGALAAALVWGAIACLFATPVMPMGCDASKACGSFPYDGHCQWATVGGDVKCECYISGKPVESSDCC